MSDIFVRYLDMDVNVSEHVIQNPDGSYTIFILKKQILRELSTMPTTVGQEMLLE